jgi:50S ribosomal subunit-associated GTPase HflX
VDINAPDFEERINTVEKMLAGLNLSEKRQMLVFNKTDKVEGAFVEQMELRYGAMAISCVTRAGIDQLVRGIEMELDLVPAAL